MSKTPKGEVLRRLRRAVESIPPLREVRYDSQDFRRWRRDTRIALGYSFGEDSRQLKEFEALRFSPVMWSTTTPDSAFQGCYIDGLNSAQTVLESMIEEVQQYWEEPIQSDLASPHAREAEHAPAEAAPAESPDARKVLVVHGRNTAARDAMFVFLRSVGLRPIEWSEAIRITGNPNPFVGEVLDAAFNHARAVLVLITPDETTALLSRFVRDDDPLHEREPGLQARPNVLFEAGMAMGRSPERTVLVQLGDTRPFSDIGGRHVIRLTSNSKSRHDLADRLRLAGCDVNTSDRDWHTTGDSDASIEGIAGDPRAVASGNRRTLRDEDMDENDKRAILAGWFRKRPANKNRETILFSEVDDELGLPPGTAKRYLKEIATREHYSVLQEGANTLLLEEEPLDPEI